MDMWHILHYVMPDLKKKKDYPSLGPSEINESFAPDCDGIMAWPYKFVLAAFFTLYRVQGFWMSNPF